MVMPDEPRNGAAQRPSPEALLAEAAQEGRGRLKIFLGAAPGVGKTYEMLTSARRRQEDGVDVVVAVVETHGRRETAALIAGLEVLPRRTVAYRGRELEEMDLDALLARRPQLALVDELAHDNAPGSRHPKRWQDVAELLAAGIDVWSTMNVQHVESLNDVVAQITHVRVRETVPNSVLDQAEIELIDLTPDELRERLHEGKVYVPEQARRALDHYFSPGNLTALRELALRRTAERVDDQMVQYMRAHGLAGPWAAGDRLLVCVHGGEGAAELVRYTKRLADRLKAPWTAIHIQTAGDRRAGETASDRIADSLRLAERLGGEALVLPGQRIADEVLAWARANNVTQIIIGSVRRSGWRELLGGSLPRDLIRGADDITIHVLPEGGETTPAKRVQARRVGKVMGPVPFLVAGLLVAVAAGAGWLLQEAVNLDNIALVFVLPVLVVSLAYGLWPALAAAVAATFAYNFLFLDPIYTLQIAEPENVAGMLLFSIVALVASGLAARTRDPERGRPGRGRPGRGAVWLREEAHRCGDDRRSALGRGTSGGAHAQGRGGVPAAGGRPAGADGRVPARGPARRQRPRRRRVVLAQRHAGRPRLGQPAGSTAPVPPLAHRPWQARRRRHPQGLWPGRC